MMNKNIGRWGERTLILISIMAVMLLWSNKSFAIGVTGAVDSVTCNGDSNGIFIATLVSGDEGMPNYNYYLYKYITPFVAVPVDSIKNVFLTSVTFNKCTAGTYYVMVVDAAAQYASSGSSNVKQPAAINIIASVSNVTCTGNNDGSIGLTVSGGNSPYTYSWSSGQSTKNISGLSPGNYTITVTDRKGCTKVGGTYTITDAAALDGGQIDNDQTICSGGDPALLTDFTSPSGGSGTWTYDWEYQNNCVGGWTGTGSNALDYDPPSGLGNTRCYRRKASNACGLVYSNNIVTVTVNNSPTADAGPDDAICEGGSVNIGGSPTASGGTGGPYTYAWNPAAGLSATDVANPNAGPATTTTYAILVTDGNACTDSDEMVLVVNENPTADAGADQSVCNGTTAIIGGTPTATGGSGTYSYMWSPAAGLSATNTANPGATIAVVTTYSLTVLDSNGCTGTDEIILTPVANPLADAGPDRSICNGNSVVIGGAPTASGGTGGPYTYAWDPITDLDADNIANPTANPGMSTPYTILVTDGNGCTASNDMMLTVFVLPNADAGSDYAICIGSSVTIGSVPTATGGTSPYSYAWNPAAGLSATNVANPVANPTTSTTYTVLVTDFNGCTHSDSMVLIINANPTADAGIDKTICAGGSVAIGGAPTATGGSGTYTYRWTPAAGLSATNVANPNANPAATATYTISITDSNGCTDSDAVIVTVNGNPVASAGTDKTICNGGSVAIGGAPTASGGSGAYTYMWTPIAGLSATNVANPNANPAATTTYTISIVDGNGCTASDAMIVVVNGNPVASAGTDKTICNGSSIAIGGTPTASGGSGAYTYMWTPIVGLSATNVANPNANPAATTTYTISIVDGNGCTASDAMIVVVNGNPVASAGTDKTICNGGSVAIGGAPTASGGSGAYTYMWTPIAGLSATNVANPNANPAATATYTISIVDGNGCTASDAMILVVNGNPVANAGTDKTICNGGSVAIGGAPTASGGSGVYTYMWTPIAGLSATNVANPNANPVATATYTISIVDGNGCTASDAMVVVVNANPTAAAGTDKTICNGSSVAIGGAPTATGGSGTYTYRWTPVAGLSATNVANPNANPAATVTYTISITDSNGCTAIDAMVVMVNNVPVADAGADKTICNGNSVTIGGSPTASGGAGAPYTYAWAPAGGLSATNIANPNANPGSTTVYSVLINDGNGCTASDAMTLTVSGSPVVNAGPNQALCQGGSVTIGGTPTASSGTSPYTYSWSPVAGLSATNVANPTANPTVTTAYTVLVTDINGCTGNDNMNLIINSNPTADAGTDKTICNGGIVAIGGTPTASGGNAPYTYMWTPAAGLSATNIANPNANPAATSTYTISIRDVNGCTASDAVIVNVNSNPVANAGTNKTICNGGTIAIGGAPTASGGAGAPYTYVWAPAAGLSAINVANPDANPAINTTYSIVITDSNGCTASDEMILIVNNTPVADAGTDQSICNGATVAIGGTPTASGGAGAPYTYAWAPAAGLSAINVANPNANPVATTTYIIIITDGNGCTASDAVIVNVNSNPIADAGTDKTVCNGGTIAIGGAPTASGGAGAPYTYAWAPVAGLSATNIANPNANPVATTTYTILITDGNGCTASDAVIINITTIPVADAGTDKTVCNGETVAIGGSPTATGGAGAPYTYAWAPAAGLSAINVANPVANPAINTTYSIVITDSNGCTASDEMILVVNNIPVAAAGANQTICNGATVAIGGAPTASGGAGAPYTYVWAPAAGLSAINVANPDANPVVSTTYSIVITDGNGCTASDEMVLTVNSIPVADAGSDQSICNGGTVAIGGAPTASGGTGAPYTYAWAPAAGLSAINIANPDANPVVNTTYSIVITDGNACTASDEMILVVNNIPVADAGTDQTICDGATVAIGGAPTASGGAGAPYTYAWAPAAGLSAINIANPDANPVVNTTYTVVITDGNGCTASDEMILIVNNNPLADAGSDQSICNGGTVAIGGAPTASGGAGAPYTYAWAPAAGLSAINIANPDANPVVNTTYSIVITDGNGCTASDEMILIVNNNPLADAGSDQLICNGGTVVIGGVPTASGGAGAPYTYAWAPAAGLSAINVANPDANPVVNTTYTVVITDGNGCTASDDVIVNVNNNPVADAGVDQTICNGGTVAIGGAPTAGGGAGAPYTYAWAPPAGLSATNIANPDATPVATIPYTVVITDGNGCTASDDMIVNVNNNPVADAGADIGICNGATTAIGGAPTASGGAGAPYTYTWAPVAGLSAINIANPNANPAITTTYSINIIDGNGCTNSDEMILTVNTIPVADAGIDQTMCNGSTVAIGGAPTASGGSGIFTYDWTPVAGLSSANVANPNANPVVTTTYVVSIIDSNGCSDSDDMIININNNPVADAGADFATCSGGNTTIGGAPTASAGTGAPYTYAWSPAAGLSAINIDNPVASPVVSTTYMIVVTDGNGCTASDEMIFTAYDLPAANILPDPARACMGSGLTMDGNPSGGSGIYTHDWSGAGAASLSFTNIVNPVFTNPVVGSYKLVYKVIDDNGCEGADSLDVEQLDLVSIVHTQVNLLCNGDNNASIGITVSGGTSVYNYLWSTADGSGLIPTNEDQNGLTAGTYDVTVTDDNGCESQDSYTITEPTAIDFAGSTVNPITNYPVANDGSIHLIVNGGTGDTTTFAYVWTGPGAFSAVTQNITNLIGGMYNVTVTDDNLCQADTSFLMIDTTQLIAFIIEQHDISCFGANDGMAVASNTPPMGNVYYNWYDALDVLIGIDDTITGLSSGNYYVIVSDDSSRIDTAFVTIIEPAVLTLSTVGTDTLSCFGDANGIVDLTIAGGTPVYSQTWSSGETTEDLINKTIGTYSVTVTDANGCSDIASFVIDQPTQLTIAGVIADECSAGSGDGSIDVTPSGGTTAYTFLWNTMQVTEDINLLNAGSYTLTVTDDNGCTVNDTYVIAVAAPMDGGDIESDQTIFIGDPVNLTSTTDPSGGAGVWTYDWEYQLNCAGGWISAGINATTYNIPAGVIAEQRCYRRVAINNCGTVYSDVVTIDINATPPVVDAGSDATICGAGSYTVVGASVLNSGIYQWTSSGDGTFDNDSIINPTYMPGPGDIALGSAKLYLTAQAPIPQPPVTDSLILTISALNISIEAPSQFAISASTQIEVSIVVNDRWSLHDIGYTLISPAGQRVTLKANEANILCNFADSANLTFTTELPIDDSLQVCYWPVKSKILSGTFAATGDWTNIYGEDPFNGDWRIEVMDCDNSTLDTIDGQIEYVSLKFTDTTVVGDTVIIGYKDDTLNLNIKQSLAPLTCTPTTYNFATGVRTTCHNSCDAQAVVHVNNGVAPFTFDWSDPTLGNNDSVTLCPGLYTVTVTDALGCTNSSTINVTTPPQMVLDSVAFRDTLSFIGDSTHFVLYVSNGEPPLTFTVDTSVITHNVGDTIYLKAGTYDIHIRDFYGCPLDTTITIWEPNTITVVIDMPASLCYGDTSGTIQAIASSGTPPYTFVLDSSGVTIDSIISPDTVLFTGISIGVYYRLVVTDSTTLNSLTLDSLIINPVSPAIVFDNITTKAVTNQTTANGEIHITAHGGSGGLQFMIASVDTTSPFQVGPDFTALRPGNYTVTARDGNGCEHDTIVTVHDSTLQVTVIVQPPSCFGRDDGKIIVTVTLGVPSFAYSVDGEWDGMGSGLSMEISSQFTFVFPDSCQFHPNLRIKGDTTYEVFVQDATQQFFLSVFVPQPAPINVALMSSAPARCQYIFPDSVDVGALDISVAGGTAPYSYDWLFNGSLMSDTTEDLNNLFYGTYSVILTDANGCTDTTAYTLDYTDTIWVAASSAHYQYCLNDPYDITGDVIKGAYTHVEWRDINNNFLSTNKTYSDTMTASASYVFVGFNNLNSCLNYDTISVTLLPKFNLSLQSDTTVLTETSVFLKPYITDSVVDYGRYEWTSLSGDYFIFTLNDYTDPYPIFTAPVNTDTIRLMLTARLKGFDFECPEQDTIAINVEAKGRFPTAFSPNGDGINDTWYLGITYQGHTQIEVYNRWGKQVYHSNDYNIPWDGTFNGKPLPIGTYFYIARFNSGQKEQFTGSVTILR